MNTIIRFMQRLLSKEKEITPTNEFEDTWVNTQVQDTQPPTLLDIIDTDPAVHYPSRAEKIVIEAAPPPRSEFFTCPGNLSEEDKLLMNNIIYQPDHQ